MRRRINNDVWFNCTNGFSDPFRIAKIPQYPSECTSTAIKLPNGASARWSSHPTCPVLPNRRIFIINVPRSSARSNSYKHRFSRW
jgi:hypothetical protein